jgi:hypothetical protein
MTSLEEDNKRYKQYLKQRFATTTVLTTAKLDLYLQEPTVLMESSKFPVLFWWSHHSSRFLMLVILSKSLLMTPMTSIAFQSALYTSGRVLSSYQTQSKPATLKALVYTQNWISADSGLIINNGYSDSDDNSP